MGVNSAFYQNSESNMAKQYPPPKRQKAKQNAVTDLLEANGLTQSALALALTPPVTQQNVDRWAKRGWVPLDRAVQLEAKYGVSRWELVNPKLRLALGGAQS
jgi:primosomal protein N'